VDLFQSVADQILVDAKPPKDAVLPGGNGSGVRLDVAAGQSVAPKPWMLGGWADGGQMWRWQ
jgi:phosphoribosylanthranilate isomerase